MFSQDVFSQGVFSQRAFRQHAFRQHAGTARVPGISARRRRAGIHRISRDQEEGWPGQRLTIAAPHGPATGNNLHETRTRFPTAGPVYPGNVRHLVVSGFRKSRNSAISGMTA
jgi:hypothetical protein